MEEEKTNIGFNLEKELAEQSDDDWVGGSGDVSAGDGDPAGGVVGACFAWLNPVKGVYQRTLNTINHAIDLLNKLGEKYIPDGTVQRGREDWMNCASNAPNNENETQLNYIYHNDLLSDETIAFLKEYGYINPANNKIEVADAFTSILSGTTKNGNSLKAPLESIRKNGLIPKVMLPDDPTMTWEQYHNPKRITAEMREVGKKFLEHFQINYTKIYSYQFAKQLGVTYRIMDSYVDHYDNDYVKQLAPDYRFLEYGYQVFINCLKKKIIINPQEDMKLYQAKNQGGKVFQKGADGLYHHLVDEEKVISLYGQGYGSMLEMLPEIKASEIGFEMLSEDVIKTGLIAFITNLIAGFKGRK